MSMWGDIHRRNSGEVTRKEDHINLLDVDGFITLIKNTYKEKEENMFFQIGQWESLDNPNIVNISIPIEERSRPLALTIRFNKDNDEILPLEIDEVFFEYYPNAKNTITLKKKQITNRDCIDVLDKLLKIVEKPLMVKEFGVS